MSSENPDGIKTKSSDWTLANLNFLFLITTGYIIGEISHFLIGVTSKAGCVTTITKKEKTKVLILNIKLSSIKVVTARRIGSGKLSSIWRPDL